MPTIYDNITKRLQPALVERLREGTRADFCVGYFNLRGWSALEAEIERWAGGDGAQVRLLIGMHRGPEQEVAELLRFRKDDDGIDPRRVKLLEKEVAASFREQLTLGPATNRDEAALRSLSRQLHDKKVVVKLFLRHTLHAKLYLVHRPDTVAHIVGYLGSSNLTLAGLSAQGELNVDVTDPDASTKLQSWFDARWADRFCVDVTEDLARIIDESWAADVVRDPYLVYLKMAYHLSQDAREGLAEFSIPRVFGDELFEFQRAAVKIAAHHVRRHGGVLIGDVVGLGKTLMATALAKVLEEDEGTETLIICPKNLVDMWEDYVHRYRLQAARVMSLSVVERELPERTRRYRVVVLDESHNLRSTDTVRYRAIQEYLQRNESRVVLLSATPYNKSYQDLSAQLKLFVDPTANLGIRPEQALRKVGPDQWARAHSQTDPRSLAAFDTSDEPEDWRNLMRRYLVRRTRGFIKQNYAGTDERGRQFLTAGDGTRRHFPQRVPRSVTFPVSEGDPADPYGRLYAPAVVDTINRLTLPRYGLGNYADPNAPGITRDERAQLDNLSKAGQRLMGFCRTNLFKRLESSGHAFLQSIERHVHRNEVYLYALDNGLPIPLGTQDERLVTDFVTDPDTDQDPDADLFSPLPGSGEGPPPSFSPLPILGEGPGVRVDPRRTYEAYRARGGRTFRWLRPELFTPALRRDLAADVAALRSVLDAAGPWDPHADAKLAALRELLTVTHHDRKVLVFSQFADTVGYLATCLAAPDAAGRGAVDRLAPVTGDAPDPTAIAHRFSPVSNRRRAEVKPSDELRVLVATDVLSEGQNLQDCAVVVNYDLPWAIIRLIQRAGRVDRIGQEADDIHCYTFLPATGVEQVIHLRRRVRQRLHENAEVVGADEAFFEEDQDDRQIRDLYSEMAGILDGDAEGETDLTSYAYQIWKNAEDHNPAAVRAAMVLPNVVYATQAHAGSVDAPEGVLVFARTPDGNDELAWVARDGTVVSEDQRRILDAAACTPDTLGRPRHEEHHALVDAGVRHVLSEETRAGGQLGRPSGARYRLYTRLKPFAESLTGQLPLGVDRDAIARVVQDVYAAPLTDSAKTAVNNALSTGANDLDLAALATTLRDQDRLTRPIAGPVTGEPSIICSMGLFATGSSPLPGSGEAAPLLPSPDPGRGAGGEGR